MASNGRTQGAQPSPPEPPAKGIEVGLLPFIASIVGVLLIAGIIGGVLWITRDGGDPPAATKTDPTQPTGALTGTPTLSVTAEGQVLVYSFTYAGLQDGDYFNIKTGPSPEQTETEPIRVESTEYRQGLAEGQQCATVQVVRGSQRSGWSKVQCETVRNS